MEADRQIYRPGENGRVQTSAALEDAAHLDMAEYPPVYSSSDESVAYVDGRGKITAKRPGTALITSTVTYGGESCAGKIAVCVREK